ncbi:ROK family transcriptional regulator [Eleftheria terrae]|uniref:ROK family transcriptional regulator n=1 Tax=Eleftheria terrae TaxID=1597781 RepID=UPI00263B839B|nr:ROK family transcriptional regulator [Eleftheria terrae]WKB53866.1 ROK family transcriptional regulator [Eleftheria terrae]
MDWDDLSPAEFRVLETVFWSGGASRHELAGQADFSKSKANAAVAALVERGLLEEVGPQPSTGGRRPELLRLAHRMGVLLAIDLGATSLALAVMAPDLTVLAYHSEAADVRAGPGVTVSRVRILLRQLLQQAGASASQVIGIGMGVPGPVEFDSGLLVNPPLMPGWEGFSIREYLREDYRAPAFIDNDVNLMALGELGRLQRRLSDFLVIKAGTGIGCGIVCHGEVYRGAEGSAGDVGHICVDHDGPRCHCGNLGCVEVMAAGPALARMAMEAARAGESAMLAERLQAQGTLTPEDVAQASRSGDVAANAIIQRSGQLLGRMLASLVNFFNPSHIFIGGGLARIGPLYLASIRQSIYQRSLALSTRHLQIEYAPLGERAGLSGAGVLALQETLRLHRRGRGR